MSLPKLVASKMVWATVLLLLVLSMSHSTTNALACKGGYSAGGLDQIYDVGCTGDIFEDVCIVMFSSDFLDAYWTYGCLEKEGEEKGSLNLCDKWFHEYGADNYYCCCRDENCNDKSFAQNCRKNITAPAEGELAPGRDYNRLHRMKHILLNMRI